MGFKDLLILGLTHPSDLRVLAQYWLYDERRDISLPSDYEATRYDQKTMRRCWELLDLTSRSFSAVIKELDGELARVICLFYVVLRALDTIEDDMTIPDDVKQPMLRSFHQKVITPGWHFTGSGPNEKDRDVLVDFADVVEEVRALDPLCRDVIVDICHKMEIGMADYAHHAVISGEISLPTIEDYDLYCHYVAGLVGEGLSRLFSATGKEAPWLADELELSNSMGILLQKTNIIRDFREDADDKRFFWPREIWADAKYGNGVPAQVITQLHAPGEEDRAAWVQSAMIIDALRHAPDSLDYLRLLRNQTVFRFAAIPAVMAMATLELCFMNPEMFQRNIKIRKAQAARLIMKCSNPRDVAYIFVDYARAIHAKASPKDPSFIKLSVACGKIEQWAEHYYPSFVQIIQGQSGSKAVFDPEDPRTLIGQAIDTAAREDSARIAREQAAEKFDKYRREREDRIARGEIPPPAPGTGNGETNYWEVALFVGGAFVLVLGVTAAVVFGVLYMFPVDQ